MPTQTRVVAPGPKPATVRTAEGQVLSVPAGWALLEPGDAGLTRRVKAAGPTWTVKEKKGRRMFSRGVYAPAEHIEHERQRLEAERATPQYQRKLESGRAKRARDQEAYVEDFHASVLDFLAFHERHAELAIRLATAVTEHATPVGSGTVARTQRIPVERRAEAAVIAWMRHQTTAYDNMQIQRIKGERRRVRRMLAERSNALLQCYRRVIPAGRDCPLEAALGN